MKLLAFIEAPDHVCYRYRVAAFADALEADGWELEAVPLASGGIARWRQLRRARRADVVLLQRKLLPLWQLRALRQAARRLVYDFDDAVFHRDSYHRKGVDSWQRMAGFWATVFAADLTFAGNSFLAEQAARFVGADRVRLFPTTVVTERYPQAGHAVGPGLRLVWIGQRSTLPSVLQMHEPLRAASDVVPGLRLHVVSDVFPQLAGVEVVPRPWSELTEASDVAAAEVGISWLPDDRWSRGKCGLKVLQYMAAGLPVVANPVGVHREMIVDGVTGFLVSTPQQWAAAIRQLAGDATRRAAMGAAARDRVEKHYSVARWQSQFVRELNGLSGRGESSPSVQRRGGASRESIPHLGTAA